MNFIRFAQVVGTAPKPPLEEWLMYAGRRLSDVPESVVLRILHELYANASPIPRDATAWWWQ